MMEVGTCFGECTVSGKAGKDLLIALVGHWRSERGNKHAEDPGDFHTNIGESNDAIGHGDYCSSKYTAQLLLMDKTVMHSTCSDLDWISDLRSRVTS